MVSPKKKAKRFVNETRPVKQFFIGKFGKEPMTWTDHSGVAAHTKTKAAFGGGDFWTDDSTSTGTNKTLNSSTNDIHADSIHEELRNETGSAINKGDAVFISGFNVGLERALITLADSTSAATMPSVALVEDDTIANNATGEFIESGTLSDVKTSDWSVGDALWVSETGTTGNTLTNTKPTGTAEIQKVGEVLRSHATRGVIEVFGAGRVNDLPNVATHPMSMGSNKITSMTDPTSDQDAATKKYVDDNDSDTTDHTALSNIGTNTHAQIDTHISNEPAAAIATHAALGDAHHNESHTIASHSDTTGTGAELNELTDGSETTLHSHAGGGAEVNDLTDAVTWDDIPDANVPESAVTQHEAAIDHDALTNFLASEHLAISAGEGIDVSGGGVVSGEDATSTNKGIAKFATPDFVLGSGNVTARFFGSTGATVTFTTMGAGTVVYGTYHGGQTHSASIGIIMPRAGSIIGIAAMTDITALTGAVTLIIHSRISNTVKLTTSQGISGTGQFTSTATAAYGTHNFAAGQLIQISLSHATGGTTITGTCGVHLDVQFNSTSE